MRKKFIGFLLIISTVFILLTGCSGGGDLGLYSGSISGKVEYGNILSITNDTTINVMATIKEGNIYRVVSDIAVLGDDNKYHIEHVKTGVPLTIISIDDYDNDNTIEENEFFGQHENVITLSKGEHRRNIIIYMFPEN